MTVQPLPFGRADWPGINLVVFDIDGTLYDQPPVRRAMALALLRDAITTRSTATMRAIAAYRRHREGLGDIGGDDFEGRALAAAAADTGLSAGAIAALVADWMEQRALPHIARARAPGIATLFDRLRASGRQIGAWSDHPATAKLAALGLAADFVVAATDAGVGRLKPDPRGLEAIMAQAGTVPARTLMIGDRRDRDGRAAEHAGTRFLLRSRRPVAGVACFHSFDDGIFVGVQSGRDDPGLS